MTQGERRLSEHTVSAKTDSESMCGMMPCPTKYSLTSKWLKGNAGAIPSSAVSAVTFSTSAVNFVGMGMYGSSVRVRNTKSEPNCMVRLLSSGLGGTPTPCHSSVSM